MIADEGLFTIPHVLLVDPCAADRAVSRHVVTNNGCRVSDASDGFEALAIADEDPPHVVVTELELPAMNGFQLCAELHDAPATRGAALIVVTRLCSASIAFRYLTDDLGAVLLRKPLRTGTLSAKLENVLQTSARLREVSCAGRRRARVLQRREARVIERSNELQRVTQCAVRWHALVERIMSDFVERPMLTVTVEQAAVVWNITPTRAALSCEYLRRRGFLVRQEGRFTLARPTRVNVNAACSPE
jgi:response regulator RpfG family c-di-GMP phosphodiesterase